jgi:hypothetical protein
MSQSSIIFGKRPLSSSSSANGSIWAHNLHCLLAAYETGDSPCPSCFQKYTALQDRSCISVRTIRELQLHLTLFFVFNRNFSWGKLVECFDSYEPA